MDLKIFAILLCRSVPVNEVEIFFFHYSQCVFEISCFSTWFPPQDRLDCDSSCHPVDLQDVDATVKITRQMDSAILECVNATRSSRIRYKSEQNDSYSHCYLTMPLRCQPISRPISETAIASRSSNTNSTVQFNEVGCLQITSNTRFPIHFDLDLYFERLKSCVN